MTVTGTTASRVRDLTADDCWALLRTTTLGRLAVSDHEGADIFPVNYLVHGQAVLFRSAPGTKLIDLARNPVVAFEADGADGLHRWSVVVRGTAQRLDADDVIEESEVLGLPTLTATEKLNYVRITARQVSGRRFRWEGVA